MYKHVEKTRTPNPNNYIPCPICTCYNYNERRTITTSIKFRSFGRKWFRITVTYRCRFCGYMGSNTQKIKAVLRNRLWELVKASKNA